MHRFILLAIPLLCGCVSDQTRQDVANSAQASYNAAVSLPASPQTAAIEANQVAIGAAMDHPLTVSATGSAVAP